MIPASLPSVFAVVVVVVPGVVVHVGAATPSVRTVVVVFSIAAPMAMPAVNPMRPAATAARYRCSLAQPPSWLAPACTHFGVVLRDVHDLGIGSAQ